MKLRAALVFLLAYSSFLFAQRPAPAPPPQTARQALLEVITGGQKAIGKHLTIEVQQLLDQAGMGATAFLAGFDIHRQIGGEMQTFESGPTLLMINQPTQRTKVEVRIENDDLSGDEDTFQLSLNTVRENSDQQPEEWEAFLSHFTVNLKKQAGIWRLNKVGVNLEFPVGDAEFLKKTILKGQEKATGVGLVAGAGSSEPRTEEKEPSIPAEQLVGWLVLAEYSFAQQHPDVGFTCSLSDLGETTKSMGLSSQTFSGGIYQGYRFNLTGCQGRPAGSFQIVAEPTAQGTGGKAFCTDATRNVRVADDGRGSTCLSSGRVPGHSSESDTVEFLPQPRTEVVPVVAPPQ